MGPAEEESNSGSEAIITAPPDDTDTADAELFGPESPARTTIPGGGVRADVAAEAASYVSAPVGAEQAAQPGEQVTGRAGEAVLQDANITPIPADTGIAYEGTSTGWRPWTDLILHQVPQPLVAELAKRRI